MRIGEDGYQSLHLSGEGLRAVSRLQRALQAVGGVERAKVVPDILAVYAIQDILKISDAELQTSAAFTSTGAKVTATVPDNQRWTVFGWDISRTGDGTFNWFDLTGLPSGNGFLLEAVSASQTRNTSGILGTPFIMPPGCQLRVNCDAVTVSSTFSVVLLIQREPWF